MQTRRRFKQAETRCPNCNEVSGHETPKLPFTPHDDASPTGAEGDLHSKSFYNLPAELRWMIRRAGPPSRDDFFGNLFRQWVAAIFHADLTQS